jgi:hypothetical protein
VLRSGLQRKSKEQDVFEVLATCFPCFQVHSSCVQDNPSNQQAQYVYCVVFL